MNRSLATLAALTLCAGAAQGQMDRFTASGGVQPPGACPLTAPYGIGATSEGGCMITGGYVNQPCQSLNLVRVKSTGVVAWERRYGPSEDEHGGIGTSVEQTADGGSILAALLDPPGTTAQPFNLGILKVDLFGSIQWAYKVKAIDQNAPVAYKQWDCPRARQLPDGSYVAIGVTQEGDTPCGPSATGVLVGISAAGVPLYAREFGQAGFGGGSQVAFTDLVVNSSGIFVLGAMHGQESCDHCQSSTDGLLAWFDLSGNFLRAWRFDCPFPRPDQCYSDEWGDGLAMDGLQAYFSLQTDAVYTNGGDALVARFDVGAGTLVWSERITDLFPTFHGVERNSSGNILVAGHWSLPFQPGLAVLDPATGLPVASRIYQDPRVPLTDSLQTFRGIAPVGHDLAWLCNGQFFFNTAPDLYYMQVDGTGKSACSWSDRPAELTQYIKVKETRLELVSDLSIQRWPLVLYKPNTVAVNPCP